MDQKQIQEEMEKEEGEQVEESMRQGDRNRARSCDSRSDRSRSRSNNRQSDSIRNQQKLGDSLSLSKNYDPARNGNDMSIESEIKEKPKLKKGSSKVNGSKDDKAKKKRQPKQLITDFTQFLPQSLLYISKTNITTKIRIGQRYQADVPLNPAFLTIKQPIDQWKIWSGCTRPQQRPTDEHLRRFKEILGTNRTEQEFIAMRERLGITSWGRVLQWAQARRSQLRWTYHTLQRNKQS